MRELTLVFASKAARVFVFGFVSIMTPIYIHTLGYSPFLIGFVLMSMMGGNVVSNILLTWYGDYFGRKKILLFFSVLMFISGLILFATEYFPLILAATFIGNISATGTEAGPFQSVETGILPSLAIGRVTRAFGEYNFIGYVMSSLGAFSSSIPAYFHYDLSIFHSMYLVYGLAGLLLLVLYGRLGNSIEVSNWTARNQKRRSTGLENIGPKARRDIGLLSSLFSIDAFGGGFVTQSILAYWFFFVFHLSLSSLGPIFLVANVITALSTLGASFLAEKMGNLRTMVFSHLISNGFLILIPLSGSLLFALAFLFLRQSVSQMDVPTRQAFMAQLFNPDERVTANAITNTSRSVASLFGSPIVGASLAAGLASLPILVGGFVKILYDLSIFVRYKKEVK